MFKKVLTTLAYLIGINLVLTAIISLLAMLFGYDAILGNSLSSMIIYAFIVGISGSVIGLLISKPMAKWLVKISPVEKSNALYQEFNALVKKMGLKHVPELGIYQSDEPNAFATGFSQKHSLVAVSSGLLQRLSKGELEAVLAHEIAHVRNGDMVASALINGVLNSISVLVARVVTEHIDNAWAKIGASIGVQIVLGILLMPISMLHSRRREYVADSDAADAVGKQFMISALHRLADYQESVKEPEGLPAELTAFGITNNKTMFYLWRSHPLIQERIDALTSRL